MIKIKGIPKLYAFENKKYIESMCIFEIVD